MAEQVDLEAVASGIGVLIEHIKGPASRPATRELSLVVTKLEEALLWLRADKVFVRETPVK